MVKNDKSNNNRIINTSSTETEEIIGRLKEALGVKSDGNMANYLGISRQNIGAARKRNDVPSGWIYKVATLTGCSMDWLRFGHRPKTRVEYTTEGVQPGGQLASQQSPYDPLVRSLPASVNELQTDEDSVGFGAAVEMLAKIYSSQDTLLIRTITANIRAFCESIDHKQREQRSRKELENLKKRLTTIEKQLQPAKPTVKKTRKSNR
jgi:hypothetical protein